MEKLEMQDLENISGGISYDNAGRPMSQDVCPFCGFPGLIQTIDWDSPNQMEVLLNLFSQASGSDEVDDKLVLS